MSEQVVNIDLALERLGNDKEFLVELLNELAEQVDETVPKLQEAINGSNFSEVDSLAHGLKGAAANLNADLMATQFKDLEFMGKNSDLNGALEKVQKISDANIALKELLKTF